jgi:DNA polymerase-3 subunit beta
MKFTVEREHLLKPLQQVSGPLGGRPTLPILGNLLLQVADGTLSLTGTDLEMEMIARVTLSQPHNAGATTVPARKFFDICRGLPEGAEIAVQLEGDRMLVRSGRSRFSSPRCLQQTSRTWMTGRVKLNSPCRRRR